MSIKRVSIIVVGVIIVIGMLGYIFFGGSQSKNLPSSVTSQPSPRIPVKDFSPNTPMSQKTTILIQTSDSSDIKYIVPTNQVATYVKSLPEGYHVVSKSP